MVACCNLLPIIQLMWQVRLVRIGACLAAWRAEQRRQRAKLELADVVEGWRRERCLRGTLAGERDEGGAGGCTSEEVCVWCKDVFPNSSSPCFLTTPAAWREAARRMAAAAASEAAAERHRAASVLRRSWALWSRFFRWELPLAGRESQALGYE